MVDGDNPACFLCHVWERSIRPGTISWLQCTAHSVDVNRKRALGKQPNANMDQGISGFQYFGEILPRLAPANALPFTRTRRVWIWTASPEFHFAAITSIVKPCNGVNNVQSRLKPEQEDDTFSSLTQRFCRKTTTLAQALPAVTTTLNDGA